LAARACAAFSDPERIYLVQGATFVTLFHGAEVAEDQQHRDALPLGPAFLTTGGLPPRARDLLGLPWSPRRERAYQAFAALWRTRAVNWLWDRLPMRLRYNTFAWGGFERV
jgi:uncharacterized protein (DUF2236 family)